METRRGFVIYFILFFVFVVVGCDDGCSKGETRCSGDVVQVCNSNQEWEDIDNCKYVGEGTPFEFRCDFDPDFGQHVCVIGSVSDAGVDGGSR